MADFKGYLEGQGRRLDVEMTVQVGGTRRYHAIHSVQCRPAAVAASAVPQRVGAEGGRPLTSRPLRGFPTPAIASCHSTAPLSPPPTHTLALPPPRHAPTAGPDQRHVAAD